MRGGIGDTPNPARRCALDPPLDHDTPKPATGLHRLDPCRMLRAGLVVLAIAVAALGLPSNALAETRPHYDLQIALSYSDATLDVVQKTSLRNNTGVELSELVFHVTPAYFDAFDLQSAGVDGQEVQASRNGTVLELALNAPLPSAARAEVELHYRIVVPAQGGRFGRGEGVLALGNFFPVLAVYQEGWDRHQYAEVGDAFYTEVADFDVAVTSDIPVTIAASAQRVGQEGERQSFHAEGVRDFAMAVSNRYRLRTAEVDGVQLTLYSLSESRLQAYLDAATRTLQWFSANLGQYPYPTLSIAEIHVPDFSTAQEYPGLIMVYSPLGWDGGGPGSYSEYLVGHEVAHQWFYAQVGNDQVHEPWLDEAMATYADFLFYRYQYPQLFNSLWQLRVVAGYQSRLAVGDDRPVDATIYDFGSDATYFGIVYRKGAVFLNQVRELMGDEQFLNLVRDYVRTYSGKVATPRAFLDMAYLRAGSDLPPLVARYFSYGAFRGGVGYQLEVDWPDQLTASGSAAVVYRAGFPVEEAKVWLDSRLIYRGPGEGFAQFSLEGLEEGEYVMRLDLVDTQGTLYQRAQRVSVAAG